MRRLCVEAGALFQSEPAVFTSGESLSLESAHTHVMQYETKGTRNVSPKVAFMMLSVFRMCLLFRIANVTVLRHISGCKMDCVLRCRHTKAVPLGCGKHFACHSRNAIELVTHDPCYAGYLCCCAHRACAQSRSRSEWCFCRVFRALHTGTGAAKNTC